MKVTMSTLLSIYFEHLLESVADQSFTFVAFKLVLLSTLVNHQTVCAAATEQKTYSTSFLGIAMTLVVVQYRYVYAVRVQCTCMGFLVGCIRFADKVQPVA